MRGIHWASVTIKEYNIATENSHNKKTELKKFSKFKKEMSNKRFELEDE